MPKPADPAITWTPERNEQLTALWREGLSCSEIGKLMAITRCAVIGKAHRMGLPRRKDTSFFDLRPMSPPKPRPPKPAKPPKPKRIAMDREADVLKHENSEPITGRATIMQLRNGVCRWPIGTPGQPGFGFCAEVCEPTGPYCQAHSAIAYTKLPNGQKPSAKELARALRRYA
jgi:GcrA cell cycle regulator